MWALVSRPENSHALTVRNREFHLLLQEKVKEWEEKREDMKKAGVPRVIHLSKSLNSIEGG